MTADHKNILKLRILLWLLLAGLIGYFIYFKIVPSGRISYVYRANQSNYFIGKLSPAERVSLDSAKNQYELTGDPVYFSLKTPRRFEQAEVTVKFKNTADCPIVEMGLLNDKTAWGYELKPLQNKIIDQISLVWPSISGQSGERLIQKEKKYQTVKGFLGDLAQSRQMADQLALYDYNLKDKFVLAEYQPEGIERFFNIRLRGSYQFYTYIKNEDLYFIFNFTDLNENDDSDPVDIKIYSTDRLEATEHLGDNSELTRMAKIKIADLPEGVYRLSVIANNDIVTENIVSHQSRLAFINKIWLAETSEKDLTFYTNSRELSVQTINPLSLGKIKVGEEILDLSETYKQFFLKTSAQVEEIKLPMGDMIVAGDGLFSPAPDNLFDPRHKTISANFDINREKIGYILTNYQTSPEIDGWQTASAVFDLTKGYQEKGKYQFMISAPGLGQRENSGGQLIIKEIKIDLQGTSLRQKINKLLKKL